MSQDHQSCVLLGWLSPLGTAGGFVPWRCLERRCVGMCLVREVKVGVQGLHWNFLEIHWESKLVDGIVQWFLFFFVGCVWLEEAEVGNWMLILVFEEAGVAFST